MRVGIKLDIGFATAEPYRQLYGERRILEYLRDLGTQAVETPVGPETEDDALRKHARQCCEAGLLLSFHPYSEATLFNPASFSTGDDNPCRQVHERLLVIAAKVAQHQESETIVNIHPAAGPRHLARATLIDQSVRFFEWAQQWCRANAPAVHPVAELQIRPNPGEPIRRVGDNYAELLEIVERSGCDVCWDLGHAYMNTKRFGLPLDPPAGLLARVAHVHCHDAHQEDHQPLIMRNVPWRRFLGDLAEIGFDSTVILEVPPQNFSAAGGPQDVSRSIRALREYIDEMSYQRRCD